MKTIAKLNEMEAELTEQLRSIPQFERKKSDVSLLNNIRFCKRFLQTNPDEDKLKSECAELIKKRNNLESRFDEWHDQTPNPNNEEKPKRKAVFRKESGILKLNRQIKQLTFILEE